MRPGDGVRSSSKALARGLGATPRGSYLDQARGDTPGSDRLITGTTQQIPRASRNSAAVWRRLVPARDALVPAFRQAEKFSIAQGPRLLRTSIVGNDGCESNVWT